MLSEKTIIFENLIDNLLYIFDTLQFEIELSPIPKMIIQLTQSFLFEKFSFNLS